MSSYHKRAFYPLGHWSIDGHALKVYGISKIDAPRVSDDLVQSAEAFAGESLPPASRHEGGSEGLGYAMLHAGDMGTWLLVHWWAHEDICCQLMALAQPGKTQFESVKSRPLLGCVWEQVVMQHERDAWVRHMMVPERDVGGYRDDRLAEGTY